MKVIRARTAGFCMGVGLALRKLDQALEACRQENSSAEGVTPPKKLPRRLVMFGPIIHNPQVLADYAARGVARADSLDALQHGDSVVIRAHGIPCQDEERIKRLGVTMVDATCPKVKQAQLAIAGATALGAPLYLFGEKEHPEVRGLVSYAAGNCHVFGSIEELQTQFTSFSDSVPNIVLAAQTTQEREEFETIRLWLEERRSVRALTTICNATRQRQEEAARIAEQVAGMIIVGGRDSGNTRRLVDVVRSRGIPAWHIETPDEVSHLNPLRECPVTGITAGASTPGSLIDEVQNMLESL